LPVGVFMEQRLVILRKQGGQVLVENDLAVRFVPMVESNSSGSVDGDGM